MILTPYLILKKDFITLCSGTLGMVITTIDIIMALESTILGLRGLSEIFLYQKCTKLFWLKFFVESNPVRKKCWGKKLQNEL